jgi:hypothetical protein
LYFFVVNFFVSNIFKGLKLKAIIHKNCNFITQENFLINKLQFNTLLVSYLAILQQILIKFRYFLNDKPGTKAIMAPVFVLHSETNSVTEDSYFFDTLVLIALRDLENEI